MITTIRRSGNSYIIRVPREEMDRSGVAVGEHVYVELRPVEIRPKLRPDLQAIVDQLVEDPEVVAAFELLGDD